MHGRRDEEFARRFRNELLCNPRFDWRPGNATPPPLGGVAARALMWRADYACAFEEDAVRGMTTAVARRRPGPA